MSVKDVNVDAGGKGDTAASPPRLFLPPTAQETRPCGGAAQILTLKRSHTAATLHFAVYPTCFNFFDIKVRVCAVSTVLPGGQDLGRGLSSEGGWRRTWGVHRPGFRGLSRFAGPSRDCYSLWWCLASYNLQNAHPFAEVWWMGGGGGGVEWKRRGMKDYSDTYRNGGLRCLMGKKKRRVASQQLLPLEQMSPLQSVNEWDTLCC